ncbi:MAG: lipopolysaccharide biosynthesis protein [Lachnospiraceae bacterium]
MWIKGFLREDSNIERDSFIWNMTGSMLMAFQSVIMLMILTRTLGLKEAGIFTIAYANANLFLTIGKYGMRNFQVSDVTHQYSFSDYRISRILTSVAMILVSVVCVLYIGIKNDYTQEKSMVILFMCVFKLIDVIEDVYHGLYQQKGRLDIAGRALTLRLGITIIVFGIGLVVIRDLLTVLIISTIFTTILFVLITAWSYEGFRENVTEENHKNKDNRKNRTRVISLLRTCFPLFVGSFLSFYIGNAPKYAIDSILNDELQACYGFIAMPVFVIGLLNTFIFNPMIFRMSLMWIEHKKKEFAKQIGVQISIIIGITLACVIGAYLIGVPVLSVLYNADLSNYKMELLILLVGGGFLALSGLLATLITIIRFQKSLIWGYVLVALLAYFLSPILVERYSMMGAAVLYLVLMGILCAIFTLLLGYGFTKESKDRKQ